MEMKGATGTASSGGVNVDNSVVVVVTPPEKGGDEEKTRGEGSNYTPFIEEGGVRRPVVVPEVKGPNTNQLQFIRQVVLHTMMRHAASVLFKEPVNPTKLKLANYYQFIEYPMDLGSIRDRLTNRYYRNVDECLKDFNLMFCNAYVYNAPGSFVVQQANQLELTMIRRLIEMPVKEEIIPEGRKVPRSRRSSTSSITGQVEGGDSTVDPVIGDLPSRRSATSTLRLREVMTKPPSLRISGGKNMKSFGLEDSSGEEETGDSDDKEEENEDDFVAPMVPTPTPVKERASGKSGKKMLVEPPKTPSPVDMVFIQNSRERRNKQMALIQEQMANLTRQMEALKEEELMEAEMLKGKFPVTPKPSTSAASGGGRKFASHRKATTTNIPMKHPSKSKKTTGTATTSKKRAKESSSDEDEMGKKQKKEPVARVAVAVPKKGTGQSSSSSSKVRSAMTSAELTKLTETVRKLSAEEMVTVFQIAATYDFNEIEEGSGGFSLNFKTMPTPCQWEIWDYAERLGTPKTAAPLAPPVTAEPSGSDTITVQIALTSQSSPTPPDSGMLTFHAASPPPSPPGPSELPLPIPPPLELPVPTLSTPPFSGVSAFSQFLEDGGDSLPSPPPLTISDDMEVSDSVPPEPPLDATLEASPTPTTVEAAGNIDEDEEEDDPSLDLY